MSLDKIQQSVTTSATHEAEQIVKAAQVAASGRLEREREAAQRAAEQRYAAATRAIDDEMARKVLQARGAANKQLLERRNAVLKRVFDDARAAVLAWPAEKYRAFMERQLAEAAGSQGGKVRIHPDDREVFQALLTAVNASRDAASKITIDESEPLPDRGGFIFIAEAYEVDRLLDTILRELEHDLAPELAAELFKGIVA